MNLQPWWNSIVTPGRSVSLKIRCSQCRTFLVFAADMFAPFGGSWFCPVCKSKHEKEVAARRKREAEIAAQTGQGRMFLDPQDQGETN